MEPTQRYWFPAKRYGWGWGLPRTWEGWLVLAAYLAVVAAASLLLRDGPEKLGALLVATAALLWVSVKRGEPPRWRWGGD